MFSKRYYILASPILFAAIFGLQQLAGLIGGGG